MQQYHHTPLHLLSEPDRLNTVSVDELNYSPNSIAEPRVLDLTALPGDVAPPASQSARSESAPVISVARPLRLNPRAQHVHTTVTYYPSPLSRSRGISLSTDGRMANSAETNVPLTQFNTPRHHYNRESLNAASSMSALNHSFRAHSDPSQQHESSPIILVAEDNLILQKMLIHLLKGLNLRYHMCANGLQAVEEYKRNPHLYSLFLSDIQMPVMDGFEAAANVREFERTQNMQPLPVVAYTSCNTDADRAQAEKVGFSSYLVKPCTSNQLQTALTLAMEDHHQRQRCQPMGEAEFLQSKVQSPAQI